MGSILDIYTGYFGLSARPFAIAPDPDMLYWSNTHRRAYSLMEYAIVTRAPITLVTGEVGAGKTLLVQYLLRNVGDDVVFGLVSQVRGKAEDVLPWVLLALGEPAEPDDSMVELFSRFEERLIQEYAAGRRVVLVFDEAQNLSDQALEQIRTLTNMNTGTDELLQVFLVGQSGLRDRIIETGLQPLAQRIGAACHLPAMDEETTGEYVRHRLKAVGGDGHAFTEDAVSLVHERTGGLARLVNQLCDFSMVYAFSKGNPQIDRMTVMQVINDGVFFAGQGLLPPAAKEVTLEDVSQVPMFRARPAPQD